MSARRLLGTVTAALVLASSAACGRLGEGNTIGHFSAASTNAPANVITVDIVTNQKGRLTHMGNGLIRTFNQYDVLGRVTKAQHVIGNSSYVYSTIYGYPSGSAAANGPLVVASTFPDGERVTNSYDATWARQSITTQPCQSYDLANNCTAFGNRQTIIASVIRNARGQTTQANYGDGTTTTHSYNDSGDLRLRQIQTYPSANPATLIQYYAYSFDADSNVTGVTDYCNEALIGVGDCSASSPDSVFTANYQYDTRNQLIGGTWSYAYDDFGNLTNKEGQSQCYGNGCGVAGTRGPHALAHDAAGLAYQYDANGNLTARSDGLAIAWDAENMPRVVSGGPLGANSTNKYFLESQLFKKVSGTSVTYYLPELRIEDGATIKYFDGFAERSADGTLKFYHGDHLGSSTLVTDASGSVVHRQAYKPYGEDRVAEPAGTFTVAAGLRYQFNYKEKEQDGSGFYDYGARLYNPATGRWLSADDQSNDGHNRYAYVQNNPLRYVDPTGHQRDGWDRWVFDDDSHLKTAISKLHFIPDTINSVGLGFVSLTMGIGFGLCGHDAQCYRAGAASAFTLVTGGVLGHFIGPVLGSGLLGRVLTGGTIGAVTSGGSTAIEGGNGKAIVRSTVAGFVIGGAFGVIHGSGETQQLKLKAPNSAYPETKTLAEWLKHDPDLLWECRMRYKHEPEWFGIDPDRTPVGYATEREVRAIRAQDRLSGRIRGHHPHQLSLKGQAGQELTYTGEEGSYRNAKHREVTTFLNKIKDEIKAQVQAK
jgi:RHS repeat-associated protein